jgi:hypothetical protein
LKHSSSEYVLFLSANDFVLQNIFKSASESLAQYPEAGLWSAMGWLVDEFDCPVKVLPQAVVSLKERYFSASECFGLAWRFGNWFVGTSVIYRRATLERIGRFDPNYRGLADLISALCVACKQGAVFSPEPLAVFRLHADSFLTKTLGNRQSIEPLLAHLNKFGPLRAPELFTPLFLKRTERRFLFSAVHASRGRLITEYADLSVGVHGHLLRHVDALIHEKFATLRITLAFLILRPFDIWPSVLNRYLGTAWIAFKATKVR